VQKSIQLVTGLLLVMVTGLFWGTWFSLSRTMYKLPSGVFITIGKEIIKNVAVPMSIIMPASIIGLLILLIGSWRTKSVYFYCILITLVLFIIALVITVAIEVPIDNQIKTWTEVTTPTDWPSIRDRWEFYHTARTFVSLGGFTFFMIAIMNRK
jgi:asparagine N-glycosylation enzyme membrane subunit Stt3